jgi:hypothetical protein
MKSKSHSLSNNVEINLNLKYVKSLNHLNLKHKSIPTPISDLLENYI